jgi:hypothetical protein
VAPLAPMTPLAVPLMAVGLHIVWRERPTTLLRAMPMAVLLTTVVSFALGRWGILILATVLGASLFSRFWGGLVQRPAPEAAPTTIGCLLATVLLLPLIIPEMPVLDAAMGYSATLVMAVVLALPVTALVLGGAVTVLAPWEGLGRRGRPIALWAPFMVLVAAALTLAPSTGQGVGAIAVIVLYGAVYVLTMSQARASAATTGSSRSATNRQGLLLLLVSILFLLWGAMNPVVFAVYAGMTWRLWAALSYQRLGLLMVVTVTVAAMSLHGGLRALREARRTTSQGT